MRWKSTSLSSEVRRIARLRHKLRSSLRRRGLAKTLRLGWNKVRRHLSGDISSPYRQWQKENRRRGMAEALHRGWKKVRRRLGWVSSDDYQNWIEENRPRFDALARQRRWAKNTEGVPTRKVITGPSHRSRKLQTRCAGFSIIPRRHDCWANAPAYQRSAVSRPSNAAAECSTV